MAFFDPRAAARGFRQTAQASGLDPGGLLEPYVRQLQRAPFRQAELAKGFGTAKLPDPVRDLGGPGMEAEKREMSMLLGPKPSFAQDQKKFTQPPATNPGFDSSFSGDLTFESEQSGRADAELVAALAEQARRRRAMYPASGVPSIASALGRM